MVMSVNPKSGPLQPTKRKEGFGNITWATPPELTVPQHRKALGLGPAGAVATAGFWIEPVHKSHNLSGGTKQHVMSNQHTAPHHKEKAISNYSDEQILHNIWSQPTR